MHNVRSRKWRIFVQFVHFPFFATFVNARCVRCLSTQLCAIYTLAKCVFPFSPLSCTGWGSWAVCDLGTPSPSRALPPSHIKNHLNSRSVQHHVTHFCILYTRAPQRPSCVRPPIKPCCACVVDVQRNQSCARPVWCTQTRLKEHVL